MQEIQPNVAVWTNPVPLSDEQVEAMVSDPVAMYLHSLRTHKRLPERMHEAMLLHSFSPAFSRDVQNYLLWVAACEEREARMNSFRRSESLRDVVVAASMFLLGVALISILVAEFLR